MLVVAFQVGYYFFIYSPLKGFCLFFCCPGKLQLRNLCDKHTHSSPIYTHTEVNRCTVIAATLEHTKAHAHTCVSIKSDGEKTLSMSQEIQSCREHVSNRR